MLVGQNHRGLVNNVKYVKFSYNFKGKSLKLSRIVTSRDLLF